MALFPSVPSSKALKLLEEWLRKNDASEESIKEYVRLTKLCIVKKFFQFNGKYYSQKGGLTIGNALSSPLSELFMSDLEIRVVTHFFWMFRCWLRYVDDILCVVKRKFLDDALKLSNLQEESLKFTSELEK